MAVLKVDSDAQRQTCDAFRATITELSKGQDRAEFIKQLAELSSHRILLGAQGMGMQIHPPLTGFETFICNVAVTCLSSRNGIGASSDDILAAFDVIVEEIHSNPETFFTDENPVAVEATGAEEEISDDVRKFAFALLGCGAAQAGFDAAYVDKATDLELTFLIGKNQRQTELLRAGLIRRIRRYIEEKGISLNGINIDMDTTMPMSEADYLISIPQERSEVQMASIKAIMTLPGFHLKTPPNGVTFGVSVDLVRILNSQNE